MAEKQERLRLLLVDDEADFLDSTAKALSHHGFEVFRAPDAGVALRLMGHKRFDVAVLGIKMPGMPGKELFREIKRRRPMLPVIVLTGPEAVPRNNREGGFEFLTRFCDVDRLADAAREAAETFRRTAGPDPQSKGKQIRLLVVDDEEELLDSFFLTLRRRGMQVATAENAVEALQWMDQRDFDVVVLDVKMPGMDGISLLSLIKDAYPLTEIILLTGHPCVETAVYGMREGAFDYLTKPQDMDTLVEKIKHACARSRARTQAARKYVLEGFLEQHLE